jgi:hypothetical protein
VKAAHEPTYTYLQLGLSRGMPCAIFLDLSARCCIHASKPNLPGMTNTKVTIQLKKVLRK